jgi:hypothetical protein
MWHTYIVWYEQQLIILLLLLLLYSMCKKLAIETAENW